MKFILILCIISYTLSNSIITKKFVSTLKKEVSYEVYDPEENPFRDWTDEEIRSMLGTKQHHNNRNIRGQQTTIKESYDFRKEHKECSLLIRDQAKCGSCWGVSAVNTFQQRICLFSKGKQRPLLSIQDIVSCSLENMGCNGGWPRKAWEYLTHTGTVEDQCFPYTSQEGKVEDCVSECKNGQEYFKYKAKNFMPFYNVEQIQQEITKNGPVQTGFDVYADFMNYKGGIYVQRNYVFEGGHAVVIVGYGTENGINYWICENSWGSTWGEQGYFRIKMGECGIDSEVFAGIPNLN